MSAFNPSSCPFFHPPIPSATMRLNHRLSVICRMFTGWPLTVIVDEISQDEVRATVSHPRSIHLNMLEFLKLGFVPAPLKETINGIFILAAGKYVCLIVKSADAQQLADGMIFLDLTNRTDIIHEIGEKFGNDQLKKKFLQTVDYIFNNPDTHSRILLVPAPR